MVLSMLSVLSALLLPVFSLSWGGWALLALVTTQLIILLVTVFFHRACSHRSVVLAMPLYRICTFLSWFLMGMDPQQFAAVHRKHHATCDTPEDPHSPLRYGWAGVLFGGVILYWRAAHDKALVEQYGKGLPSDPLTSFYRRYPNLGLLLGFLLLFALFGGKGVLLWAVDTLWIPVWAAGVINGLGHFLGYRNHQTADVSTNLVPWGVWLGGEELHNNHHAYPASAKFSLRPWEIDLGWGVVRVLCALGWAEVRMDAASGVGPVTAHFRRSSQAIGLLAGSPAPSPSAGLASLLRDRHRWLTSFQEAIQADAADRLIRYRIASWRRLSCWSDIASRAKLSATRRMRLDRALSDPFLARVHLLETDLRRLWDERGHVGAETLTAWIEHARALGWDHLDRFADRLNALLPKATHPGCRGG